MLKVRDLVKKLKKVDQDAFVVTQDHDNSDDEVSGWPSIVFEMDASEFGEMICGVEGTVVVIKC